MRGIPRRRYYALRGALRHGDVVRRTLLLLSMVGLLLPLTTARASPTDAPVHPVAACVDLLGDFRCASTPGILGAVQELRSDLARDCVTVGLSPPFVTLSPC